MRSFARCAYGSIINPSTKYHQCYPDLAFRQWNHISMLDSPRQLPKYIFTMIHEWSNSFLIIIELGAAWVFARVHLIVLHNMPTGYLLSLMYIPTSSNVDLADFIAVRRVFRASYNVTKHRDWSSDTYLSMHIKHIAPGIRHSAMAGYCCTTACIASSDSCPHLHPAVRCCCCCCDSNNDASRSMLLLGMFM